MTRCAVALILLAAAACGRNDARNQAASQQQFPVDDGRNTTFQQDSLRDWFIEFGLVGIPDRESDLLATVGVPDSVVRLGAANVMDPVAFDTVVEAYYPGLTVSLLKQSGAESLQSVWVADTTFIMGPIRPGMDSLTLVSRLGPSMVQGSRPGYVCAACSVPNQAAFFDLVNGTVSAILFTFPH
ncbi:MAG TPA: hypothetical protein VF035_07550 [Longimicrobiales bacterium]